MPASDRSLLASFLRGLALYRKGSLEEAAKAFRLAVRTSPDFLAGILYLGACYASGGRTKEAVGAWQTSLIGDDAPPEIFALVADGYLRMGDADAAADILVEAGTKWPEDERFIVRAALARAAAGRPGEALASLMPIVDRSTRSGASCAGGQTGDRGCRRASCRRTTRAARAAAGPGRTPSQRQRRGAADLDAVDCISGSIEVGPNFSSGIVRHLVRASVRPCPN